MSSIVTNSSAASRRSEAPSANSPRLLGRGEKHDLKNYLFLGLDG